MLPSQLNSPGGYSSRIDIGDEWWMENLSLKLWVYISSIGNRAVFYVIQFMDGDSDMLDRFGNRATV